METNDAKREALEAFLRGYIEGKICAQGNYPPPEDIEYLHSVVKKAQDALAQPRKNFEVGTPEEQETRFDEFCMKYSGDDIVCNHECPLYRHVGHSCALAWGQMPYDESEKENEN